MCNVCTVCECVSDKFVYNVLYYEYIIYNVKGTLRSKFVTSLHDILLSILITFSPSILCFCVRFSVCYVLYNMN